MGTSPRNRTPRKVPSARRSSRAPSGSLLRRFVATPLEGQVIAKTGSIDRVNSLSGYIERRDGRTITFSVQANAHAAPYARMLAQIDSVVVEIGKTR